MNGDNNLKIEEYEWVTVRLDWKLGCKICMLHN
jgi:hypothetical protein